MLVKTVIVFLLAMVALGMVARALGLGRGKGASRLGAALCPRCGRLTSLHQSCACGAPPRS